MVGAALNIFPRQFADLKKETTERNWIKIERRNSLPEIRDEKTAFR